MTTVKVDLKGDREARSLIKKHPRLARVAAYKAANATVDYGVDRITEAVAAEVGLRKDIISARVRTLKASATSLTGYILPTTQGIRLTHFRIRRTERGVLVRYRKNRSSLIRSAFYTWHLGGRQVFKRAKRNRNSARLVKRLPIKLLYGPSMHELVAEVLPELLSDLNRELETTFVRQLDREIARA